MTQDRTRERWNSGARADTDGASTMDLSGRCVGSAYLLVRPIGQGATGTVWRGMDQKSGEPVAIKLLHDSLLRQPKLVTRFVQERTILLMLRHRNVVRVRDLFSVGETLGLVMDLVSGGSLRDHLRERHTVPVGEAARLAAQVAAALAEAHDLGIVHRDLKPDNILLKLQDGRLDTRLTDFGVARILNAPSMTTPSAIVGTPHYMAPEAFHGTTASPATDVYALGVLLYEMVSGRPPYDTDSIPELMRMHMTGGPERRPGIPDAVWDVIMACMALKPRLRPTAAELVADLSDLARDFPQLPALPRPGESLPGHSRAGEGFPGQSCAGEGFPGRGPADDERVAARHADEAPSLIPLPRPPHPGRGNQPPSRRWARPGATVALVAGAMVASAVATAAWNYHRGDARTGDVAQSPILATPSGQVVRRITAVPPGGKGVAPVPPAADVRKSVRPTSLAPRPRKTKAATRATRSPQPEAIPYGSWVCTKRIAIDLASGTPFVPQPCRMTGRDIQYQATLTAPGGATGSITVALQDANNGRTVGRPKTCSGLFFGGRAETLACGPASASPARGHNYAVVMSYRYVRDGRALSSTAQGEAFTW